MKKIILTFVAVLATVTTVQAQAGTKVIECSVQSSKAYKFQNRNGTITWESIDMQDQAFYFNNFPKKLEDKIPFSQLSQLIHTPQGIMLNGKSVDSTIPTLMTDATDTVYAFTNGRAASEELAAGKYSIIQSQKSTFAQKDIYYINVIVFRSNKAVVSATLSLDATEEKSSALVYTPQYAVLTQQNVIEQEHDDQLLAQKKITPEEHRVRGKARDQKTLQIMGDGAITSLMVFCKFENQL